MRPAQLKKLLHEHESTTLDFKREHYPLTTEQEKGELIKDIIAFANTPRRKAAHIIIGITEEQTPPHAITGITEPRYDHNLQQLVNSKLNRPISFTHETHKIDGHTISIITIAREQHPPHHLTTNFGRLEKNDVYIRRGSSTAKATPDEITRLTRRPRPEAQRTTIQPLDVKVMYRHDEMITVSGGHGIPGFAYTPRREHRFSLGHYIRLDAKLLITPSKPLLIIHALSTATITSDRTIPLDAITIESGTEKGAETTEIPTPRVIRITGSQRVNHDILEPSRAGGISITIALAGPHGKALDVEQHLTWDGRTEAFTHQHQRGTT